MSRALPTLCAAVLAPLLALCAVLCLAAPAQAVTVTTRPALPKSLPTAIEPLARYVGQTSCDPHTRPGTAKLAALLARTYGRYGAAGYNTTYACGTDGTQSEHYDGRAIDWMVSIRDKSQHAAALSFLKWLLAPDAQGDQDAMARRLGVMYVIYDNRMWGGWGGGWQPYDNCAKLPSRANDNTCHRTHMHISLSWDGAYGRTSFWTGRVPLLTDYGPCRLPGLNWAPVYSGPNHVGCPRVAAVRAPKGASATKKALVTYSGAGVHSGSTGPAVTAVQRALHVTLSGSFGGSTRAAVMAFQRSVHLAATGAMNPATWLALLAKVR